MLEKIGSFIAGVGLIIASWFGYTPEPEYVPITEVNTVEVGDSSSDEDTFGAFNPVGGQTYRLKTSIGTTDTTILLSSFKEPITGNNITMTTLNSDIGYATIDPQSSSRKEFVSFTGITQNSDGSATLTGVSRGLSFQYPFTASSTLRQSHPGQSILILSDSPQFFAEYARLRSDETITGYWSAPSPTSGSHLATRDYVLSAITGTSSIAFNKVIVQGTGGETFATGTILYLRPSDQRWYKLDVDDSSHYMDRELGVAQGPGTSGGTITNGVLTYGLDSTQVGMTGGNFIFAASTAGATTTSTTSQPLGVAISATTMFFDSEIIDSAEYVSKTYSGTSTFSGQVVGGEKIQLVASTTLTGATLPVPVFITASGTASTSATGATTSALFNGFAITNTSAGGIATIQLDGIVPGFSGLTKGAKYFVSATGTISTTQTGYSVPVGTAVSPTEILIEKQLKRASGMLTLTATQNFDITLGFRPSVVRAHGVINTGGTGIQIFSNGSWNEVTGHTVTYMGDDGSPGMTAGVSSNYILFLMTDGTPSQNYSATITNVSNTGFRFANVESSTVSDNTYVYWEAEGY